MYKLSSKALLRLKKGIIVTLINKSHGDVYGEIFENILCYVKKLDEDAVENRRSKLLFDVVDLENNIGYSAKARFTQSRLSDITVNVVIKRYAVFKEHPELNEDSDPQLIGDAAITAWREKILGDSATQVVIDQRIVILIKDTDRKSFSYYETDLDIPKPEEFSWEWTNDEKVGLRGIDKKTKQVRYILNPSQGHFNEKIYIPEDVQIFTLEYTPLDIDTLIENNKKDAKIIL